MNFTFDVSNNYESECKAMVFSALFRTPHFIGERRRDLALIVSSQSSESCPSLALAKMTLRYERWTILWGNKTL